MKTYDHLPYDVSAILRDIVAKVETNLVDESTLEIPRVTFRDETYINLVNTLKVDSESIQAKGKRYPLIALVRNYDIGINARNPYQDLQLDIVILTLTDPKLRTLDRIKRNYTAVLYPIYTEFMEQLVLNPRFHGYYNPYPEHRLFESHNFGKRAPEGNNAYIFPDYVDALVIAGLKLRLNRPRVASFNYGPTAVLQYQNNVSYITCAVDGIVLSVTLAQAIYVDTSATGTPAYSVVFVLPDVDDNEVIPITVGATINKTVQGDGRFYGYVRCADGITESRLAFYYEVNQGTIVKYSTASKFRIHDVTLNGFEYPYNEADVTVYKRTNRQIIKQRELSLQGGNVWQTDNYLPLVSETEETTVTMQVQRQSSTIDFVYNILIDGPGDTSTLLESTSYIKLS